MVGLLNHNLVDLEPSINCPTELNSYFVTEIKSHRSNNVKGISLGFEHLYLCCVDAA
jgi:hypothetical protein